MKNKKFSMWLQRLPVLFTALILLITPLFMVVPARADVLSGGSSYWSCSLGPYTMLGDQFASNYVFYVRGAPGNYLVGYVFSDDPITIDYIDGEYVFRSSSLYNVNMNVFEHSVSVVDLREDFVWPISDGVYTFGNAIGLGVRGDVTSLTGIVFPEPVFDFVGSVGVLSVFSGVGSWLGGAVQSASSMFWNADSGLTVLGYLAVASLALAVILLIFYLIAGWLKFH